MGRILCVRERELRRRTTHAHVEGLAIVRVVAIRAEQSSAPMFRTVPVHQIAMTGGMAVETDFVRGEADVRHIGHVLHVAPA